VRIETLNKLKASTKDKQVREEVKAIRKIFNKKYRKIRKTILEGDTIATVISGLEAAQLRLDDWPVSDEDFSVLEGAIQRVYKQGVRAMTAAYETLLSAELFHEWRKHVKYLRYHIRLLNPIWPAVLEPLAAELHQLSENLGEAHDYAMLHREIERIRDVNSFGTYKLLAQIDYHRAQMEQTAKPLGLRIYAESPHAFVLRLQSYWTIWQEVPLSEILTSDTE
jgi:CHAD domain-containing protein